MNFLINKFNLLKGLYSSSHSLQQHSSYILKPSFQNIRFTKRIIDSNGNVKDLGFSEKYTQEVVSVLKGYYGHSIVSCIQRVDLNSTEKIANLADLNTGSFEKSDLNIIVGSLTSAQKVPLFPRILNAFGLPRFGYGRQIHVDSYKQGDKCSGGNIAVPTDKSRQQFFFTNEGVKIIISLQEVKNNIVVLSSSTEFNKAFENSMNRPVYNADNVVVGCVSDQIFDEMRKGSITYVSYGANNSSF